MNLENWTSNVNETKLLKWSKNRYQLLVDTLAKQMSFQTNYYGEFDPGSGRTLAACLIHASRANDEEACFFWFSGGRVSNTWVTYLTDWDNFGKPELIPNNIFLLMESYWKTVSAVTTGWARGALASWWGNGSPRRRCVADLRGWTATLGLRHGPDSYGRQQ